MCWPDFYKNLPRKWRRKLRWHMQLRATCSWQQKFFPPTSQIWEGLGAKDWIEVSGVNIPRFWLLSLDPRLSTVFYLTTKTRRHEGKAKCHAEGATGYASASSNRRLALTG